MRGSHYQQSLVLPGACRLLGLQRGRRVLDLGCGQGVLARYLHRKGLRVEGLDISSQLLALARRRSPDSILFHQADAAHAETLVDQRFDAVACLLALQNMERLEPVFQNVRRWLRPEGCFVAVITHPCFRIPRQSHWGFDDSRQIQYRRVDRYMTPTAIPILTPPFKGGKEYTMTYHRPLQDYFAALAEAGLVVNRLEEWTSDKTSEPGKRSRAENRARQEIPLFLAFRAVHGAGGG